MEGKTYVSETYLGVICSSYSVDLAASIPRTPFGRQSFQWDWMQSGLSLLVGHEGCPHCWLNLKILISMSVNLHC